MPDDIIDLLNNKLVKNISSPIAEKIGKDIALAYIVALNYLGIRPVFKALDNFSTGLSPHAECFFKNLGDKVGKKLLGKKNISSPDFELTCRIFENIKYKDLNNDLIADLMLNILASSMDDDLDEEKSDYIKYVSLINSLFPKSLTVLYRAYEENFVLTDNHKYLFEYKPGSFAEGKEITENLLSEIAHYNNLHQRNKTTLKTNRLLTSNNCDISKDLKYLNDLIDNELIIAIPREQVNKPLYFEFNNIKHAFDKSVQCTGAINLQVNKEIYKYSTYQTRGNFDLKLTDMGKYIVENFYNEDSKDIILNTYKKS